ncbi:Protein of unknown function [Mucilaginibacter pineti]|uniref:DUF2750 domain-containing protein n=1 Tax=Mucilaginibacter pineti TaxID=1391627 RepID=A0A1G7JC96_9SPHI|nr:DUF2750 domain-containing protein [Mucilaginibacter pineti]SDF22099.1 Protein of unknown function [Mucilaginibacter pineti]
MTANNMLQDTEAIEGKYTLFIEKTVASKLVWVLKGKNGWANSHAADSEDVVVIPFWSDRALAKVCAKDDWRGYLPVEIPLVEFLESWCVDMAENEMLAGINWDAKMVGKEAEALNVALDMLNRLKAINSAIAFKNYGSIDEFIADISESND